jgi:hypothetical protein
MGIHEQILIACSGPDAAVGSFSQVEEDHNETAKFCQGRDC